MPIEIFKITFYTNCMFIGYSRKTMYRIYTVHCSYFAMLFLHYFFLNISPNSLCSIAISSQIKCFTLVGNFLEAHNVLKVDKTFSCRKLLNLRKQTPQKLQEVHETKQMQLSLFFLKF